MVHEQLIQDFFLIVHLYVEYDRLNITFLFHFEYYDEMQWKAIVFKYHFFARHLNVQISIQQIFIRKKRCMMKII